MKFNKIYKRPVLASYFAYLPSGYWLNTLFINFYSNYIIIRLNSKNLDTYNLLIEDIV